MLDDKSSNLPLDESEEHFRELLRMAIGGIPEGKNTPSPESILAYIEGNATEEQTSEVQKALADSSEFQRVFLDIAESFRHLSTPETEELVRQVRVPELPLITRYTRRPGPASNESRFDSLWSRILDALSPRVLVPVAAAVTVAVLAFLMIPGLRWWGHPLALQRYTELDPSFFASGIQRGGHEAREGYCAPTRDSAAFAEFHRCISLDPRTRAINLKPGDTLRQTGNAAGLTLCLITGDNKTVQVRTPEVPANALPSTGGSVEAWVIYLPTLEVWSVSIHGDSTQVRTTLSSGQTACITFVYPIRGGFQSSPCIPISIP